MVPWLWQSEIAVILDVEVVGVGAGVVDAACRLSRPGVMYEAEADDERRSVAKIASLEVIELAVLQPSIFGYGSSKARSKCLILSGSCLGDVLVELQLGSHDFDALSDSVKPPRDHRVTHLSMHHNSRKILESARFLPLSRGRQGNCCQGRSLCVSPTSQWASQALATGMAGESRCKRRRHFAKI